MGRETADRIYKMSGETNIENGDKEKELAIGNRQLATQCEVAPKINTE